MYHPRTSLYATELDRRWLPTTGAAANKDANTPREPLGTLSAAVLLGFHTSTILLNRALAAERKIENPYTYCTEPDSRVLCRRSGTHCQAYAALSLSLSLWGRPGCRVEGCLSLWPSTHPSVLHDPPVPSLWRCHRFFFNGGSHRQSPSVSASVSTTPMPWPHAQTNPSARGNRLAGWFVLLPVCIAESHQRVFSDLRLSFLAESHTPGWLVWV